MRVGIVGAGITGLALEHYLHERGVESTVFEVDDEPGGVIRSEIREGRVLDFGPQRTRLTPGIEALIEAAGVEDEVIEATDGPLYVYSDGDLGRVPLSVREALTTDLLSWRGKLRALAEPLAGPPREGETVDSYLRRAFGPEIATRVGGPIYAGLYASDPSEMPVEYSLAKALDHFGVDRSVLAAALRKRLRGRDPPPAISFEEGMAALPRGLARRYETDVNLGTRVERIEPVRAGGYELHAGGRAHEFDAVVLTTPAGAAANLLDRVAADAADRLSNLSYNSLAVVHLHAETDLVGGGHQVALDESLTTRGVTWNDSLLDRDGVYTCYLGGADGREVVEWPDERLKRTASEEFERATGFGADPLSVHRVQPGMPAYDRSWDALDGIDVPEGVYLCANYESRAGLPGRVRRARRLATKITERDANRADDPAMGRRSVEA